jgi:hypothetical protein
VFLVFYRQLKHNAIHQAQPVFSSDDKDEGVILKARPRCCTVVQAVVEQLGDIVSDPLMPEPGCIFVTDPGGDQASTVTTSSVRSLIGAC